MGRVDLTLENGTFARASKARDWDHANQTLLEYATDAPRSRDKAITGSSDGALTDVVVNTDYHIGVQCSDGTYFYAIAEQDDAFTYDGVYRCSVADDPAVAGNWTRVSTDIDAWNIWYLPVQDRLLAAAYLTDRCVLYYSDDQGATWTICQQRDADPGEYSNYNAENAGNRWRGWEPGLSGHGTIVMPRGLGSSPDQNMEYDRSTDGIYWTLCATAAANQGGAKNHPHCVGHLSGYNGGAGRWMIVRGDGKYDVRTLVSDDDGLTWTDTKTLSTPADQQVVQLLDDGDSDYFVAGTDSQDGVCLVNAATGQRAGLEFPSDPRAALNYVFLLVKVDGIYYACSYCTASGSVPRIVVSTDREYWVPYHAFASGSGGCLQYGGKTSDGKLVFGYTADGTYYRNWRVVTISPPQISVVSAMLLEKTATNLLSGAVASGESGWSISGASTSYPTTDPPEGASYVLGTSDGSTDPMVFAMFDIAPNGSAPAGGEMYGFSWLSYGVFNDGAISARHKIDGAALTYFASPFTQAQGFTSDGERWYRIQALLESGAGTAITSLQIRNSITPLMYDPAGATTEGTPAADCVQIEHGLPSTWIDPDENSGVRADDEIAWTVDLADEWALAVVAMPLHPKHYHTAVNTDGYLLSVTKGSATCSVWYDASAGTLNVDYDPDGGSNSTILTTAALNWAVTDQQIRVVLRAEPTVTRLSIEYGTGSVLHYAVATPMTNLLSQSAATIQNGDATDHSGNPTQQWPLLLAQAALYDESFSDGAIEDCLFRPGYRKPPQRQSLTF